MKNTCMIFFCISFLLSCTSDKTNFSGNDFFDIEKSALIEGKILNSNVYPHIRTIELTIADFKGKKTEYITEINESGEFRLEFYPKTKREVKLHPIEDVLIIAPGDSLFIIKDFNDIQSTQFSGTCAQLNKEISLFRGQYLGGYTCPYDKNYFEFKKACEKEKKEAFQKVQDLKEKNNTSPDFEFWAKKQIEMDFFDVLFHYPFQYHLRTREAFDDQEIYYDFINNIESSFDNSIVISDYFNVTQLLLQHRIKSIKEFENNLQPTDSLISFFMHEIMNFTSNNYLNQFTLYAFLNMELSANKTKMIDINKDFIEQNLTDPFLWATLQEQYLQVKEYLMDPKKRSDIILSDNYGDINSYKANPDYRFNIVKDIISEFPDKVIYIDIWAIWCGPCIHYKKYSKLLMEHFDNRDVEFVFISVNKQEDVEKKIKELGLEKGKHFFLNEDEMRALQKRFRFNGFPHYLLLSNEGILIDYGLHLNPENPDTKQKIEQLLNTSL